jgi:hypothetical protein
MATEKKYKTPELLSEAIGDYFKNGVRTKKVMLGNVAVDMPVPTITGLVIHLGFCDRQSFYDYEKYKGYSCTIKKARTFIECHYEEMLQVGNTTGAIFALKNFGWRDKFPEDEGSQEGSGVKITFNVAEPVDVVKVTKGKS